MKKTAQELSELDYKYWCKKVGVDHIKLFKDEIIYTKDGKEITVLKSELI